MSDVEFFGERFPLNPAEDYQWELMEFAEMATGEELGLLEERAAVMRVLRGAITADQWERFKATARKNRAQVREHLMPVVVAAFAQPLGSRPTGLPSDSSDGQQPTPLNSAVDSYSQVIAREEAAGRPDRALMVLMAQETSAA